MMNLKNVEPITIRKLLLTLGIGLTVTTGANAQGIKDIKTEVETQVIGTTNGKVPFWMRANQFGSVPLSGVSAGFLGRIHKDYALPDSNGKKKLTDWAFGFEGRANAGKGSNLQLIEAYAKFRLGIFQFQGGRTKDVMGLNGDTLLSTGNFSVSGNAPGIPKLEISIPEYYTIPVFDGLFSFKGNFVHGWLGHVRTTDSVGSSGPSQTTFYLKSGNLPTYFHQKSLYIRLGKKDWKLKLYGGFNHQVYWGSEREAYGPNFKLSPLTTFFYVATGKTYGARGVPSSKIGNQLGSLDLGVEYDFQNYKVMIYRQNFYDVGALSKLANIADGLNGISVENKNYKANQGGFQWKKALFEFFYSKNQAGYPWSIPTKSGDEDYYNNFYYLDGWSYQGMGVGNPLITPRHEARKGQAFRFADYFINNRVVAWHAGLSGSLNSWTYTSKVTYSINYGTFGSSIYGNSTGSIRNPQTSNIFKPVKQFSMYLEGLKALKKGYSVGFATALDQGKLLDNSFGLLVRLKKSF